MKYEDPPQTEGKGWEAVASALNGLRDEIGQRHTENTSSLQVLEKDLKVVIERVDDLAKGFPKGDWEGHRQYHESIIRKMEARTRLYEELRAELARKGLWALIVAIGTACWYFVRTQLMHTGVK